jgi:hypothetical protein
VTKKAVCAFEGCEGLTSVTIPDSVTEIGGWAFFCCKGLTSVTIPDSVTVIEINAFSDSTELIFENPSARFNKIEGLVFIENYSETDGVGLCEMTGNGYTLFTCDKSKSGEYVVPDGVKTIFSLAFENCRKLTQITLPESVEAIGKNAFKNCARLAGINLPKGLKRIDSGAFTGCKSLASLSVPVGVTDVEKNTFPNRAGFTLYVDICSPVNAFAKKRWDKNTLKYTVDPERDYSGKVKIDMLKMIVTENDVASLTILLQYYNSMDKHIDELITLSNKKKNTEMSAFLLKLLLHA